MITLLCVSFLAFMEPFDSIEKKVEKGIVRTHTIPGNLTNVKSVKAIGMLT